jgi:WD40 repeat protein
VFSPNGEKLLATGEGSDVAVWQVADGKLLWRLPRIGHIVGQPFSADGSHVALEITQGTSAWTAVRNTRYGDEVGQKVVGVVASNAISPDNSRLLTTWYNTVKIWSIPGLQQMGKITTDLDWPRASYSADGKHILLNEGEQAYKVSDLSLVPGYPAPTATPMPEINPQAILQAGHFTRPVGLRFPTPDQAYSWGRFSGSAVWVNDLKDEEITTYDFGSSLMADPDLSPTGDRLAACTRAGLVVISLADGESNNLGRCRGSGVVRFSADGKTIFKANTTLIDAIDSQSGQLRYNLRGHQFLVEGIEVSDDGKYLTSSSNFQGSQGRELILWRVDEPKQLRRWMASVLPGNPLLAAVIDDEEGVLYTALGGLRGWRLGDGLQHHLDTTGISSLTLSPDGELLVTGDNEGTIHIYQLDSWEELAVLQGHRQPVTGLIFSPDAASLISMSSDGTIRLWGLP